MRKLIGTDVFFLALLVCLVSPALQAVDFAGGTGEPNDPFLIATAEQLIGVGEDPNLYDRHFQLIADIDLDPNLPGGRVFDEAVIAPFDCIRITSPRCESFNGTFDGNHHSIRHLTLDGSAYMGLFGQTGARAQIRNVKLEGVEIDGGYRIGSLVGYNNGGHIVGCSSSGIVVGADGVGGLVGYHREGCITRSTSTCLVHGLVGVGGLVGETASGYLWNCFSVGSVTGSEAIGGLVGEVTSATLENCFSSGAVDGERSVGGLIGQAGYTYTPRGGVSIAVPADVLLCYSIGSVRGLFHVGGLVGKGWAHASSSFWDIQTSGQAHSVGGVGTTSQEMQTLSTYTEAGWDFCGEHANGTADWWCMPVEGGTPQLVAFDQEDMPSLLGEGTSVSPYVIVDAHDLGSVARHWEPGAHYELVADIDLSGIHWSVAVIPEFVGRFDGKGHLLSNLKITGRASLGLFGRVLADASVRNILMEQVDVLGTDDVGALAGFSNGTVGNCRAAGRVRGASQVGVLVGRSHGTIVKCWATGHVVGDRQVGGLVGIHQWGILSNCRSLSHVTGIDDVGGLVGDNANGSLRKSVAMGRVEGNQGVGGLAGNNSGDISECYAQGSVQASSYSVGGFVGGNHGTLLDCYATGSVSGAALIGGLVGENYHRVMRCYSVGPVYTVYSAGSAGGLIGFRLEPKDVGPESSFWDLDTSGLNSSRGGTGLPTSSLQTEQVFLDAGWDFEHTWMICEGEYPRLRWAGTLCAEE